MVKNPPANAEDARDTSLIPGLGRFPEQETATRSSILAGKSHVQRRVWRTMVAHGVAKSQT